MVARGRFELPSAGPKPAMLGFPGSFSIDWRENKAEFLEYLQSRGYSRIYVRTILSYLTRFIGKISEPMDIIKICSGLTKGQRHNLNRALSALLRFYELKGYPQEFLDRLRKAIPKDRMGVDLRVPEESGILESLRKLPRAPEKYVALYNLLLDSGLRLTEAVKAINEFSENKIFKVKADNQDFYRLTLGFFRASKIAYCAYFSGYTYSLIRAIKDPIKESGARRYFNKYGFITPRYIRKFAFNKMIELGIPESIADFIQGRAPKRIGARHYMALVSQADQFYGRYADYIEKLRLKA